MAAPLSQDPEAGDLTVVNEILDIVYKDVDVPCPDSKPGLPGCGLDLKMAASKGHLACVQRCLDAKPPPSEEPGEKAMIAAGRFGKQEVLNILLSKLKCRPSGLLWHVTRSQHNGCLMVALENKLDQNDDTGWWSALMLSEIISCRIPALLKLALEKGYVLPDHALEAAAKRGDSHVLGVVVTWLRDQDLPLKLPKDAYLEVDDRTLQQLYKAGLPKLSGPAVDRLSASKRFIQAGLAMVSGSSSQRLPRKKLSVKLSTWADLKMKAGMLLLFMGVCLAVGISMACLKRLVVASAL